MWLGCVSHLSPRYDFSSRNGLRRTNGTPQKYRRRKSDMAPRSQRCDQLCWAAVWLVRKAERLVDDDVVESEAFASARAVGGTDRKLAGGTVNIVIQSAGSAAYRRYNHMRCCVEFMRET